jgi:two-component sensor histidine kinase
MCVNSRNRCHCDERLIFDELTHRINNEWAVAIGIVSIAAARSPTDEVRSALASVLNHLESLARVHRALQPPNHDTTHASRVMLICNSCVGISSGRSWSAGASS